MTHGSLFSGIGGFDLAAEWMNWENVFHCDNNEFCQKVLKYYWPHAKSYYDIKTTDFTEWNGKIDIVSGGFPCQPYSQAGKRKGKEDDRHLWPEMLRAIREIHPRWVVGENVSGLLNWSRGLVLDEIKANLEAEGFEVFPPLVLPACAVNAPHRRDRVWIVANSASAGLEGGKQSRKGSTQKENGTGLVNRTSDNGINGIVANARSQGLSKRIQPGFGCNEKKNGTSQRSEYTRTLTEKHWEKFPTQSPVHRGNDGLHSRLAGITVSKHRTESIKGYGNSIVPRVVFQIFKTIEQMNRIVSVKVSDTTEAK